MRLLSKVAPFALLLALGCGEKDLNKDIKPVDKNAPKPTAAGAGAPGKSTTGGAATSAPSAPPK